MGLIRYRQLLYGVEGFALLRLMFNGTEEDADVRIEELARLVADRDDELMTLAIDFQEQDVAAGYADWSRVYDEMKNAALDVEQPAVGAIFERLSPGRALDAACGTGRQSAVLTELGWTVTGVDATPEMLERARVRVPEAEFLSGRLDDLPAEDADFDLAVCTLALTHLEDLRPPIAELARVVRPGGRIVLSDIHPFAVLTGGQGAFPHDDGTFGYVRNHVHWHSDYVAAFTAAGLRVADCTEPPLLELEQIHLAARVIPEATRIAMGGIPFILVWELERP